MGMTISQGAFESTLKAAFSDDGDFLGSPFSNAFGIGYYDEGLKETACCDSPTRRLRDLLNGVSYDSVIIDRFESLARLDTDVNCAVLIYDHRHEGLVEWFLNGVSMTFFGAVRYR